MAGGVANGWGWGWGTADCWSTVEGGSYGERDISISGVHLEKSPRGGKSTSEDIWGGGGGGRGGVQWAVFNFEGLQIPRGAQSF